MRTYRTRNPRNSPLWQCAQRHQATFLDCYPDTYEPKYGPFRPVVAEVVEKFIHCGTLERGFARGASWKSSSAPESSPNCSATNSFPPNW